MNQSESKAQRAFDTVASVMRDLIAPLFKDHMKLTFIARDPSMPTAGMLVTSEEGNAGLDDLIQEIKRLQTRPTMAESGPGAVEVKVGGLIP